MAVYRLKQKLGFSMTNSDPILNIDGKVATITLSRPGAANRLNKSDLRVLRRHVATVNAESRIMVLRIQAAGKYFCAGYDLFSIEDDDGTGPDDFGDVMDQIEMARPVTIAAVNGGVYGGGTDLCLACDFRVGVPQAHMQMTALKLGIHLYKGGLERYVSRLGIDTAKRLLLTAEKIDAAAMLKLGVLTELVAPENLQERVHDLSETLRGLAPEVLFSVKKHLNGIAKAQLDTKSLEADIHHSRHCPNAREGLLAWKEKRLPVYSPPSNFSKGSSELDKRSI